MMKGNPMKKIILVSFLLVVFNPIFSQGAVSSKSRVNWITKDFSSELFLDMKTAGLHMPSGKNTATGMIKLKMPSLLKNPILSLYVDSMNYLEDHVDDETITLEQMARIIENGKRTPELFSHDGKTLSTTHTISLDSISRKLVKHKYPYLLEPPIESVSTRAYSGIIIDARGTLPVHGEYTSSEAYPCFFPKIRDE